MEEPKQYDIVNPLWQRGRAWGIAEEREQILEMVRSNLEAAATVLTDGDFATGVRVALERIIQKIDER